MTHQGSADIFFCGTSRGVPLLSQLSRAVVHDQEVIVSRVLTIGIATALAAGAVLAASPAHAATPVARNHVVALAGSDHYLIYEVAKASKSIRPGARNRGTLYARDAAGKVSRLTHFVDGKGVIEQTGHSLVEQTFTTVTIGGVLSGVQEVRQRDLRTGAERVVTLDPDDSMASVAPDGYVERYDKGDGDGMSDAGTTSLTYRHIDGTTADIAIPFADHTTYRLQASDQGLLAMTPPSDEQIRPSRIAYMTWADPGVWHPIYSPGKRREIYCATPSSTHVACRVDGIDAGGPGLVLLRLQDGHAT